MNELIKIEQRDGIETVNARDLWEGLESKQQFGNWIESRLEGFTEGADYLINVLNNTGERGKPRTEYYLTMDTAKHLAMLERNENGKKIRAYFIEIEKAWNTPELVFARALQAANKLVEESKHKIAELAPKAESHDAMMRSDKTMSITQCAKHFGVHPKTEVFPYLRERGYLTSKDLPSQDALDADILALVETRDRYTDAIYPQAVVRVCQLEKWRTVVIPNIEKWKDE